VLAIDNGDALLEAKKANPKLITALRHFVEGQPFGNDYAECAWDARRYFGSFIDGTYYERYRDSVDLILEFNEYYDQGMGINDPDVMALRLVHATAFANVWNDEWRGKIVPAGVRLVVGNSPVGNDIPIAFAKLAIATDNMLGYHPYIRASVRIWPDTIRDPGDWRWHSGRWNFMEQDWGLRPKWCFTEYAPYMGSTEGWHHWSVLAGDQALLFQLHRAWHLDMQGTDAYKQGRVVGPAWFTIGSNWWEYLLETPQLVEMAKIAGELWHPGQEIPMPTVDEAAKINAAITKLDEAKAILAPLAAPKHTLVNLTNQQVINLFSKAYGAGAYYALLTIATDEAYLLAHRTELYRGLPIEDMPGLTAAQKAALVAALG